VNSCSCTCKTVLYDFFVYNDFLNVGCDAVEAGFCSEVVVCAACLLTTTFMLVLGCGLVFCVLGGVDQALETLTRMMLCIAAMRETEFQGKKATFPFSLLLPLLRLGRFGQLNLNTQAQTVCLSAFCVLVDDEYALVPSSSRLKNHHRKEENKLVEALSEYVR